MATPVVPPLDIPTGWRPVSDILPMGQDTHIDSQYDWLVVGAGITGLSSARRLAELRPDDRILLVDARPVGWGASGRNSGFLIDLPHKFDFENPEPQRLKKIVQLNREAIAGLKGLVEKHAIPCDWHETGKLQGAVKSRGTGMLRSFSAALDALQEPYEELDRDGCFAIMGTRYYAGAVYTRGSVLVDPFALVRGLAKSLPSNVDLADDTAVTWFKPEGSGFQATLSQCIGHVREVRATKVILATDPFTPTFGYLKNRIVPAVTFASITRPLTDAEWKGYEGRKNWGLTPADAGGTTLRMADGGRLLIRNHYAHAPNYKIRDSDLDKARIAHREGIDKRFPQFAHIPITSTWGGVVSLSGNHVAYFGEIASGVYSAGCYGGVGMVRGAMSGKLLAELATGQESSQLEDMMEVSGKPSLLPPDPLRDIGVRARLRLAAWESKEEK